MICYVSLEHTATYSAGANKQDKKNASPRPPLPVCSPAGRSQTPAAAASRRKPGRWMRQQPNCSPADTIRPRSKFCSHHHWDRTWSPHVGVTLMFRFCSVPRKATMDAMICVAKNTRGKSGGSAGGSSVVRWSISRSPVVVRFLPLCCCMSLTRERCFSSAGEALKLAWQLCFDQAILTFLPCSKEQCFCFDARRILPDLCMYIQKISRLSVRSCGSV